MRKSFYIYSVVGALLALLCMVNCTDRELFQGQHADGVAGFSLQEAKEYFEEQAGTEPVMSRSAGRAALDPGDFAPYWESAVASSQCRLGSYDVPIAPAYRFKAVVADGNGRAGKVEVGQKLVVVKNLDTGRMSQYILSLIPTRSLAPRSGRQLCDAFVNCGDKGGFSGLAVYTCVYSSVVACVSRYEDGRRMEGVFLLDAPDASELHRRIDYARHLLSSVAVRAHRAVTTRFEWDIDGGELNGGELPEVVITPDDDYTWPPDDWLHPGYDDYETPEPEDNNSDGNEDEGYTGNTPADQDKGGDDKEVKKYESKAGDKVSQEGLMTMKRKAQRGNTCVPTIIGYLLKDRGSANTLKEVLEYFKNELSKSGEKYSVKMDGVPANAIAPGLVELLGSDFVRAQYGGDPIYDYKGAIDRGNVVMTNVFVETEDGIIGHNILVVGYTKEGNYIYIDPNDGKNEYECTPDYLEEKNASRYDFEIKKSK